MRHTSPANITQNTTPPKQNYSKTTFFLQETTVFKNPEIHLLHIKVAVDSGRNSSSVQRVPAERRNGAAATAAGGQKKKTIFGVPVCRSVAASEKRKNTSPVIRRAKQTLYRFAMIRWRAGAIAGTHINQSEGVVQWRWGGHGARTSPGVHHMV